MVRDGLTPLMTSSSRGQSTGATDESVPKALKLSHNQWKHQTIGQGILLVTEHNAEINAGFIVAFASSHTSVVSEQQWRDLLRALDQDVTTDLLTGEAIRVAECYWQYIGDFLSTCRPLEEIDSTESAVWIQTGLALTPLAGCVIQHTCDWTVACPLRRSEALRVPLRYPLRYPLRSPLRYPLRYPLRSPLKVPLKGTLKVPLQGTLQGYP